MSLTDLTLLTGLNT